MGIGFPLSNSRIRPSGEVAVLDGDVSRETILMDDEDGVEHGIISEEREEASDLSVARGGWVVEFGSIEAAWRAQ